MHKKDFYRITSIIENIKYRNWQFWINTATTERNEGTIKEWFEIGAMTETDDADRKDDIVTLKGFSEILPMNATVTMIVEAVYALVIKLEEHERREFFRYKGKKIHDPHKKQ